jgi:DNA-binding NtrC family response regulator
VSEVPVVIEGETGTGKEILAESLHEKGPWASGPFVVFDCAAVSAGLMESELFGHERGAFTGAVGARKGLFEEAHGGTLLIDEIGDLELSLQPKLLRAIERSEIRRVGGNRPIQVEVRVIAATRRNLDQEVQEGRFRDDLFHRLAVARIELPPLRERRGDIPILARHFAEECGSEARLPSDVLMRWNAQPWPGNVRELRNAVARYLALGELGDARARPGVPASYLNDVPPLPFTEARRQIIEEFEQRYLEQVLAHHAGNLSKAARAAGVSRRYLQMLKSKKPAP